MIAGIPFCHVSLVGLTTQNERTHAILSQPDQESPVHPAQKKLTFEQVSKAANEARDANRDDDAIRLYQEALALKPDWPEGMWFLSTLLYQKERFAESRDLLRQFVAAEPKAGPAWALLGMSEYQTHEYSRALDHLKRAMREGLQERQRAIAVGLLLYWPSLLTRFEQYDDGMALAFRVGEIQTANLDLLVEPLGFAALRLPFCRRKFPLDRRELIHMAGVWIFVRRESAVMVIQTEF